MDQSLLKKETLKLEVYFYVKLQEKQWMVGLSIIGNRHKTKWKVLIEIIYEKMILVCHC